MPPLRATAPAFGIRATVHRRLFAAVAVAMAVQTGVHAEPVVRETVVLGPFSGHDAELHPANQHPFAAAYVGTDLGWTYTHDGELKILFGDTIATAKGETIDPAHDDAFGTLEPARWSEGASTNATRLPLVKLAQEPGSSRLRGLDPGVPLEGLKTPLGGFSSGTREYAVFITGKPLACGVDADCGGDYRCDTGLGYLGAPVDEPAGLTFACRDGSPGCNAVQVERAGRPPGGDFGLCTDRTSSVWAETDWGRVQSAVLTQLVGVRSIADPARYTGVRQWTSNKFINVAVRTVADFDPARGPGTRQDYRGAGADGANRRVFLWSRPWFIGVNAKGASMSLYFAYVDLPTGEPFSWAPKFYSGTDPDGRPRFSADERDAVGVDLDSTEEGVQPSEQYDVVQQMSVVWVEPLHKWVMFYGGGISNPPLPPIAPQCGLLQIFVRDECGNVPLGQGAIHMRTADDPWGPWSPPQDVLVGGNPDQRPLSGQYGPGGVLFHEECRDERCVRGTAHLNRNSYGWLYGANVIEEWTRADDRGVDLYWNASTWNPYRVILLRTRIDRSSN